MFSYGLTLLLLPGTNKKSIQNDLDTLKYQNSCCSDLITFSLGGTELNTGTV